ncbi:MAG TPA: hypothetical protein VE422_22015 [Terriglobia bacterium]|nr:hypothetical protein [Terriglobia bacterium]
MIFSLRSFYLLLIVFALSASFGMAQSGAAAHIEETDPSITYSGTWYTNGSEGNSGGSAALTNVAGAEAVVSFTGTGISWIGVGDPWNGLANVTLDGLPYKIDGWADTTRYQQVFFTVNGLSIGPHKLSIEIPHERGPNGMGAWVWIDGFDIQNGGGVSGGIPAATVGRVENNNPALTYTGIWYTNDHPMHSGGSAVLAVGADSSVTLTFNGTGVAWISYRDEWSGLARIILDGELKATMDTYLSPARAQTAPYIVQGLTPGTHTLRIEVMGTKNESSNGAWIWVDAFDVMQ